MNRLPQEELQKMTKKELIEHIEDLENLLDKDRDNMKKLKEVMLLCDTGIENNYNLMYGNDVHEVERIASLSAIRVFKTVSIFVHKLISAR